MVLQWTLPWPYNTANLALYILAIFLHYMQQKWDQGTLGTQRSTLIGSRTHLGPSKDPAMGLQYTKHGPLYIGSIFSQSVSLTQYVVLSVCPPVRLFQLASESSDNAVARRRSDYCPRGAIFICQRALFAEFRDIFFIPIRGFLPPQI